ncbi:MAG: aminoglycoside phosphotransferase family protein [Thermoanaerobaculaceae bacterium]|nr:aminoglycoside phosphotransferase family protein [Thermoanaerobaculaceae bacterium]MDI9621294.1 aminoglycoside phosphotransferase family protein [Acidobacteriota bacterium]NLH09806.1 aminoglycoside phosphotransferase family protein [Holophagae bacterium]HPW54174.1 aminoglycoside phosphotransferase family protein [Thermoanaerobaculaceae bacterium]
MECRASFGVMLTAASGRVARDGDVRPETHLSEVAHAFAPGAALRHAARLGHGHINDTFLVELDRGGRGQRLVLQRLNRQVFADPLAVMSNIERVLDHLRRTLAGFAPEVRARRVLTLVHTGEGSAWTCDSAGEVWRAYLFIERARSGATAGVPAEAFQVARAFGEFLRRLADYDGPPLAVTIPAFHDTRRRVDALVAAVARDAAGRVAGCRKEIDLALEQQPLAAVLLDLHEGGLVPERITHNDTKLDNVLLDEITGEALAVLDLDTVMPGMALADFGDLVRSGVTTAAEDEPDCSRVEADPELFAALTAGFLDGVAKLLRPVEVEHLAVAGQVVTYEIAVRFLTDHLDGDTYFRIGRPGHNLDRARTQLALLRSLQRQQGAFRRIAARSAIEAGVGS